MRKRRCFIRGQMHRLRRSRCKKSEIRHGFHFFMIFFQWSLSIIKVFARRLVGANIVRPRRNIKKLLSLSYFSVTKSTKSHLRGLSSLLKNSSRVHELVARAVRGECVRQGAKRKSAVLRSPRLQLYHACEYITRKSRADSCTHCLHARYKCGN